MKLRAEKIGIVLEHEPLTEQEAKREAEKLRKQGWEVTITHNTEGEAPNDGRLRRLVGGLCDNPLHPEWNGHYCQCVNCQTQNYCVEDPCHDCTGPTDGCEPPDEDADDDANEKGEPRSPERK